MPGRQPGQFFLDGIDRAENANEARQAEDKINIVRKRRSGFDILGRIPDKAAHMGVPRQAALFQGCGQPANLAVKRDGGQIGFGILRAGRYWCRRVDVEVDTGLR